MVVSLDRCGDEAFNAVDANEDDDDVDDEDEDDDEAEGVSDEEAASKGARDSGVDGTLALAPKRLRIGVAPAEAAPFPFSFL